MHSTPGIAVISSSLTRQVAKHQSYLVAHAVPGNRAFDQLANGLGQTMTNHGVGQPMTHAYSRISGLIARKLLVEAGAPEEDLLASGLLEDAGVRALGTQLPDMIGHSVFPGAVPPGSRLAEMHVRSVMRLDITDDVPETKDSPVELGDLFANLAALTAATTPTRSIPFAAALALAIGAETCPESLTPSARCQWKQFV